MQQPRLFEFRMGERSPEALVVSGANAAAVELLRDWRAWPGGALALAGPRGSGKTHLALAWAFETRARELAPDAAPEAAAALFEAADGKLWIDRADGPRDDAMLWRLLDLARARAGAVLLVGAAEPAAWSTPIKDLRSRLAALPLARLGEPDEAHLEFVLRRICRERFIEMSEDVARYLAARMPRTFAAAQDVADTLDVQVVKGAKPLTVAQARRALESAQAGWRAEET